MRDMTISCREDLGEAEHVKQYLTTRGVNTDTQRSFLSVFVALMPNMVPNTCNRHAKQLTDAGGLKSQQVTSQNSNNA